MVAPTLKIFAKHTPMIKALKILTSHAGVGGFLGIVFLHPITMAIYWLEFNHMLPERHTLWEFLVIRLSSAFTVEMMHMTTMFIGVGSILGLGSGFYYLALTRSNILLTTLKDQLGADLEVIIGSGESETVEFKATSRWDLRRECVEKNLELMIAKTIAAFLNHRGGDLLIGVTDEGTIIGLDWDSKTLKKSNRDGFELYIMTLVKNKLGAASCPFVHIIFHSANELDVCRIIVEPSEHPVYLLDSGVSKYYLRSGNSSRQLDIEQAMKHIKDRWKLN